MPTSDGRGVSESVNRRLHRRRRLPDPPSVEVTFCNGEMCLGGVRNEHLQGLGVAFHGTDAKRAWSHQHCCLGGTLHLKLSGPDRDPCALPVRLIHLTRPVDGHLPCFVGLSLDRARLGPHDIERLLELWSRLQGA